MRRLLTILFLLLPLCLRAQEQQPATPTPEAAKAPIYTGFSGGMMLHLGYAFAPTATALFRNPTLPADADLPTGGVTAGIGGALRVHLRNHIHIGTEGFVSTMPLMGTGSQIRTGWGGFLLDYFFTRGKLSPYFGFTIGGGATNRLYVPHSGEVVQGDDYPDHAGGAEYNASYTKTPFFLIDPYVGLEIAITPRISVITRLDWILPFGKHTSEWNGQSVAWSPYISPSGPRLYVGFMFGH